VWNPEQVAVFVEKLFKKRRAKELDYYIIRDMLMAEAGVTARQAQGMLNTNAIIATRRGMRSEDRIAVYQQDWRACLGTNRRPRKDTLRQRVAQRVRSLLEIVPNQEMGLADLVDKLEQESGAPRHTLYQYISKLDFVRNDDIPNTRNKTCKLIV